MTSSLPSLLKSPAEATETPKLSPALCPFKITSASASARLVPVIPPKKIKALPESLSELLSSFQAPTTISSIPSPLKSPAEATEKPKLSPALCPSRITSASASALKEGSTQRGKVKFCDESITSFSLISVTS